MEGIKMKKNKKIILVCLIISSLLLVVTSGVLAYIYIPFYSYDHPPHMAPFLSTEELPLEKVPNDYVHLFFQNYHDADGYHPTYTVYVKEGSIHPLSYWQRFITGEYSPTSTRYVKYSANEAVAYWKELCDMPENEAYAAYSFCFTGNVQFDEELGYRVFLFVDGKDAEFIKEELTKKYGDFVVFDSEKYTRGFFKDAAELCIGWWYETPSRGYTG